MKRDARNLKLGWSLGWTLFGLLLLFLALNRHSRAGRFNYHAELFGDKAGYYVYLPLLFEFDQGVPPDTSLVSLCGYGFRLDSTGTRIQTKYTYGTALAELPFYLVATVFGQDAVYPGFSLLQHRMINVAAVAYLLAGLGFLFFWLRRNYPGRYVHPTLLLTVLSTGLLYYTAQESGMSHVYSFCLFAAMLWFWRKRNYLRNSSSLHFLVFGLLTGWIFMLRQSNLLFPLLFLVIDTGENDSIRDRLLRMLRQKALIPFLVGFILIVLPQVIYWKWAFGNWVAYSYGEESFIWDRPLLLHTWFQPQNGLFLYTPIVLPMLAGLALALRRGQKNAGWYLLLFGVLSYILSCWWEWGFGCAYGARSFTEYLVLFAPGLAELFYRFGKKRVSLRIGFVLLLIVLTVYPIKMMFSYDGCFEGNSHWDWKAWYAWIKTPVR